MGEVMMSRENGKELRVQETGVEMEMARMGEKGGINNIAAEDSAAAVGSCETVRWERFLPKMVVRVLLVEADDSTRQIISALLRKCSYRVAAVSDGLKAWEVLKGRSHNIDLILTEVDLPSISGYALLSLIMEHEICKNIPVIMMSSQDSVSTVYKCMLRGATDFLVKPVRKNELRNMWQHVWRKQASNTAAGLGPPDESIAQEKDEATAENNATSNHSSGYLSRIPRNREGIEKGDAQSSCTKPGSETEEEDIEHIHGTSKPECAKCVSDGVSTPGQEECHQQYNYNRAHESEAEGFQVVAKSDADYEFTREDKNSDHIQEQSRASDIVQETFLREAIDLIGTFDNHFNGTFETPASTSNASKFDILPMLDLSLRRSHTSGFVSEVNDERTRLNHSDASAFSRYINKPLQLSNSTSLSPCSRQMDHEMNSEKQPSSHIPNHYSDTHGQMLNSPSIQIGQPEFTFSYSQNRDISHPIAVRGVGFGNVISPYSSMMPSTYCAKSGSPSLPSQGTTHHSDSVPQSNLFYPLDHQPSSSQQLHSSADQRNSNSVDQTENKQGNKSEDFEAHGTNQSGNSSFCNGNRSHHQSQGSGCNGTINAVAAVNVPSECGSGHEETFHLHEGASQRAMQREAALTKFRQKRKDRCFDKKVRYESRKKLAEQRPRVKGQFVRQLPNDESVNTSAS